MTKAVMVGSVDPPQDVLFGSRRRLPGPVVDRDRGAVAGEPLTRS